MAEMMSEIAQGSPAKYTQASAKHVVTCCAVFASGSWAAQGGMPSAGQSMSAVVSSLVSSCQLLSAPVCIQQLSCARRHAGQ